MSAHSPAAVVRRFRAPGKLMLAGEHSVLGPGGEALALAVELGVEVEARPQPRWELRRAGPGGPSWVPGRPVPDELSFAAAAWQEACAALGEPPPHLLVARGFGELSFGPRKPGVGGSASAAVAVVAAMQGLAGGCLDAEGRERVLEIALRAHQRGQGGLGSGYDVAVAALGGLLHWRRAPGRGAYHPARLGWPAGLELLAGYSGRSAATARLLGRISESIGGAELELDLGELAAPVRALVAAFGRGDLPALLEGVRACQKALLEWDRRRSLGLVTPGLAELVRIAEEVGAAAKLSGAGGGDSAIALSGSRELLEEVARRWRAAGFLPFWPAASPQGVRELAAGSR